MAFNYEAVHREAWVALVFQILKQYFVSSVTPKALAGMTLNGVKTLPEDLAKQDDFISESEKLLLFWLHSNAGGLGPDSWKKNSFSAMQDCVLLSQVLSKYTNSPSVIDLDKPIFGEADKLQRCEKVVEYMNHVGLNSPINTRDILNSNPKFMVLLSTHLFGALPNYLPKQPIQFSCELGQSEVKII